MALDLVPGDFKVHWEAKRSPSEPFEVSIAEAILGDGANVDPDQPQNLKHFKAFEKKTCFSDSGPDADQNWNHRPKQ